MKGVTKMKKLLVSIATLFLPTIVLAQGMGGAVVQNGNAVSVVAPNAATGKVSLISPHASSAAQLVMADVLRAKMDGGGSLFIPKSNPAAGTAATTVAGSGTIDTTEFLQRVTDAGAITGVILENGTAHGQIVFVLVDKDASGSVTFAAEATSNVCSGTSAVIAAGEGAMFIYDATDTCWSELGT